MKGFGWWKSQVWRSKAILPDLAENRRSNGGCEAHSLVENLINVISSF